MDHQWKGYVFPGPRAPGREGLDIGEIPPDQTLDALCGAFKIFQYKKGHRYSTDDLLVAWYGTSYCPSPSRILDLGSGIGTVGMIAAWRHTGSTITAIEAQSMSVELAKKSARFNGIDSRYDLRLGDFRNPEMFQENEKFDLILTSPPYFPLDSGMLGDHEQKVACRFEVRGNIADYCAVSEKRLAPGGVMATVFPIQPEHQEGRVLKAAEEAGLSIIRRRNVILKSEGGPPLLGLFLMARKGDLPEWIRGKTWVDPPLAIRCKDDSIHPEYSVIKMSIGFTP